MVLFQKTLCDVDFELVASEADRADLGLGDPEFGGGKDEDSLGGFVQDADLGPDVPFGGVKKAVEAEGPRHG